MHPHSMIGIRCVNNYSVLYIHLCQVSQNKITPTLPHYLQIIVASIFLKRPSQQRVCRVVALFVGQ